MRVAQHSLLRKGTPEFRKTSLALFVAGFSTYAMLYVVQGMLPAISSEFAVSAAVSSLSLSLTTLPLALMVLFVASWSDGKGRRFLLVGSLIGAAVLTLLSALSPTFGILLTLRVLTGIVLAGFPAAAMAYVSEEFAPVSLGTAMGMYISGTGLGGMTGRLVGALLTSLTSWRIGMAILALLALAAGSWVAIYLPQSRNFVPSPGTFGHRVALVRKPASDGVIISLSVCGFVLMGSLVSYYNYLQYRLAVPPFGLHATAISLVFGFYVFGFVSSNWMGRMADRHSRRNIMAVGFAIMAVGAIASLSSYLPIVLLGTTAMVFGFFGSHSTASGFVGAWASKQKAQASALYLFGYHAGSSLAGFIGGLFFGRFGWSGEVGTVLVLLLIGVIPLSRLPAGPVRGKTVTGYE